MISLTVIKLSYLFSKSYLQAYNFLDLSFLRAKAYIYQNKLAQFKINNYICGMKTYLTEHDLNKPQPTLRIVANNWADAELISTFHSNIEVIGVLIEEIKFK